MIKYYLATTGISELWDFTADKILLLGPWCAISKKNRKLLEGKDVVVVPSPWKPSHKLKEAAEYCYGTYNELLPQLGDRLNSIHGVSYPLEYWRILLGPWLMGFVETLYDRYKRIENALMLYPDMVTHAVTWDNNKQTAFDTVGDIKKRRNEDFCNLMLFSLVAYDLCPDNIIKTDYKSEVEIPLTDDSWKKKIFYRFINTFESFFKSPIILSDMYHLGTFDMFLLKLKIGLSSVSFLRFESISENSLHINYSSEMRQKLQIEGGSDRFQSLLYKISGDSIPVCYMEKYGQLRKKINGVNTSRVKIVGSATGWDYDEKFKFFAAEATSKGATTVEFQHGGGYGMFLSIEQETQGLEKDRFYSWGWTKKHENKVLPLPSPHLSKIRDSYLPKSAGVIFVGIGMFRYHYRFHNSPQPDDMSKYFEDKGRFYQALPDRIKKDILYRPYSEIGWNEIERVKKMCPDISFKLNGRLINWMKKAKLVVIDHPQTAFLEALSINVPGIFYWDHEVFLMRSEAQKYYEMLRKAGIVYKTPEDAANKLKVVYHNPLEWWMSSEVQESRNVFLDQFGYSRKDWMKIWAEEFKHI